MVDRHEHVTRYRLQPQVRFFSRILDSLLSERERLEARTREELPEYLYDVWDNFNSFLLQTAEILLVAIYHWIEAELKYMLVGTQESAWTNVTKPSKDEILKMDLGKVEKLFRDVGIKLSQRPYYEDIQLLRHFSNSWKHNQGRPSKELIKELRIEDENHVYGLLDCPRFEANLRMRLGLDNTDHLDPTQFDLVKELMNRSLGFLSEVLEKIKERAPLQPIEGKGVSLDPSTFEPSTEEWINRIKKSRANPDSHP